MHTFYQPEISTGQLLPDESWHALKVLRLKEGDEIKLTDGKGNFCRAKITKADPRLCEFKSIQQEQITQRAFSIHLAIAPTKNSERIEWMIEKCVEIGIEKISFIQCKTSERKSMNMERLEKIVISAMKQSGQAWLPDITQMMPFEKFVSNSAERNKFIAYVDGTNQVFLKNQKTVGSDSVILIGPEGDFTKEELAMATSADFLKVSLGPNRLRTETAGLVAVMTLNVITKQL